MIGLLVEDAANPFSASLMRAVEDVARHREVRVLIGSLDEDPDRERELARELIDRRVDGLVIVPAAADHSYLAEERDAGTGLVFLDREPQLLHADAVVSDNHRGAQTAVRHLLDQGHRRIGYLGDRLSISTAAQRFSGYRHALEVAQVEVDEAVVWHGVATPEAANEATLRDVVARQPTDGAVRQPEPRDHRGVAGSCVPRGCRTRWRWSASTTFPLPTCCDPASR